VRGCSNPWFPRVERARKLVILHKKVPGLSAQALERFVLRARRAVGIRGVVNVLLTNGSAVRALNSRFRDQNKTTDVLSFPAAMAPAGTRKASEFAGEIAISADIAVQNARSLGHSAAEEVKILTLHGILHLAGFDHERDNGEMARKEEKLRRDLRLPVALIERAANSANKSSMPRRGRRTAATRSTA
jgi:probable rRNA maturation factor